jgi:hypothetical protein
MANDLILLARVGDKVLQALRRSVCGLPLLSTSSDADGGEPGEGNDDRRLSGRMADAFRRFQIIASWSDSIRRIQEAHATAVHIIWNLVPIG